MPGYLFAAGLVSSTGTKLTSSGQVSWSVARTPGYPVGAWQVTFASAHPLGGNYMILATAHVLYFYCFVCAIINHIHTRPLYNGNFYDLIVILVLCL